jgi:DNA-binding response OmpR family regulator
MSSILIIDDEATFREALSLTLKEVGYSVLEARNGREGLELLRNEPADLVLLDVFMPEKDGLETLKEIRRLQPATRIIAMSGGGSNRSLDILQVAGFLGARRTLAKPFELHELMTVVRAELSQG